MVPLQADRGPVELSRFIGASVLTESRRYDRLGRLTGATDSGGSVWSYGYDLRGLCTSANDPDLGIWGHSYDLGGSSPRRRRDRARCWREARSGDGADKTFTVAGSLEDWAKAQAFGTAP